MKSPEPKEFRQMVAIVSDWRQEYHVNREGDIIFQNKKTLANVSFSDNALHKIEKHSRGFEMIPGTVQEPSEIWSTWEDPGAQMVVLRNYIKFGKFPFIVQTRNGVIVDAFIVSARAANKFRKGVFL